MNQNSLSPNDPRLTAYALGELDLEENARVAEIIKGDVAAQAVVDEIRSLAAQLEGALEDEAALPASGSTGSPSRVEPNRTFMFPRQLFWVAGLAAACVTVMITTQPRGGVRSSSDRSSGSEAQLMTHIPSETPASETALKSDSKRLELPVADSRKRAHPSDISDVKPAPLRDDGLQRWRSVTDNRAASGAPLVSHDSVSGSASADNPAYQPGDYKNIEETNTVQLAELSRPAASANQAGGAVYEIVPVSTLEAARNFTDDSFDGDGSDASFIGPNLPRHRELLTLTIRYKLPTVDLSQWFELSLNDTVTKISLTDQNLRLALGTPGLGNPVSEAPHKSSTYDQILTWAEENQDTLDESAEPRHESVDAVKKAKRATVE